MYKSYKSIHGNDKSQEPPLIWPPLVGSTTIFAFAARGYLENLRIPKSIAVNS